MAESNLEKMDRIKQAWPNQTLYEMHFENLTFLRKHDILVWTCVACVRQ